MCRMDGVFVCNWAAHWHDGYGVMFGMSPAYTVWLQSPMRIRLGMKLVSHADWRPKWFRSSPLWTSNECTAQFRTNWEALVSVRTRTICLGWRHKYIIRINLPSNAEISFSTCAFTSSLGEALDSIGRRGFIVGKTKTLHPHFKQKQHI